MKRFLLLLPILCACATTPKGRTQQAAVIQKGTVDGVGQAYLSYCEIVRVPRCVAEDEAAHDAGAPQSKEDRVACLMPCDSSTATKVQGGVDLVRSEQTALFHLLKKDGVTDAELAASRAQLRRASEQLLNLMREHGILDLLGEAVGGRNG